MALPNNRPGRTPGYGSSSGRYRYEPPLDDLRMGPAFPPPAPEQDLPPDEPPPSGRRRSASGAKRGGCGKWLLIAAILLALLAVLIPGVIFLSPQDDAPAAPVASAMPAPGGIRSRVTPLDSGIYRVTLQSELTGLDPSMVYVAGFMMAPQGEPLVLCHSPSFYSGVGEYSVSADVTINYPGSYDVAFYYYPLSDPAPVVSATQRLIVDPGVTPDPQAERSPGDWYSLSVRHTPTPSPAPVSTPTPSPTPTPTDTPAPHATPTPASRTQPTSELFFLYPTHTRYRYNLLTPAQQITFSELYDGVAAGQRNISFTPCSKKDFDLITETLFYDCPELIHIPDVLTWSYYSSGDEVHRLEISQEYRMDTAQLHSQLDEILRRIESFKNRPGFGPSDYSKQLMFYVHIMESTVYNMDDPNCANADSAWLHGVAKCTGYTRALNLALRMNGIECLEIIGDTYDDGVKAPTSHMWTIAKIDGQWVHCDATWDDPVGSPFTYDPGDIWYMPYFNIDNNTMYAARTVEGHSLFPYPACTTLSKNYYVAQDRFVPAGSDVAAAVRDAFDAARSSGQRTFGLFFESSLDFNTLVLTKMSNDAFEQPARLSWVYRFVPETRLFFVSDIQ